MLFGSAYAFTRGAGDFAVFHAAWKLALEGKGATLYHATPDRFLYAPGFAFLFAPLGWISEKVALAFWCALKAFALVLVLRRALRLEAHSENSTDVELKADGAARIEPELYICRDAGKKFPAWIAALAVIIVARPLMIDFQYGQVNTWILLACWAALLGRAERASSGSERTSSGQEHLLQTFFEWFALAVAGWAKLFPLPLLLLPFLPGSLTPGRRSERLGVILATVAIFGLPLVLGFDTAWALHLDWWKALHERGLPLESHNQSLSAVLHHLFTGQPTHIISLYASRNLTWFHWFSLETVQKLTLAWAAISGGVLLGWLLTRRDRSTVWSALLIGGLILPSHLVWKPYFLMAMPAALVALSKLSGMKPSPSRVRVWLPLLLGFALINLTGFDLMGLELAARLEGSGAFLVGYLMILWAAWATQEGTSGAGAN